MSTTSTSLLMRLREPGEGEAWERLVELYTPLIYYLVRVAGIPSSDRDDVVQEVFKVLLQKLPEFEYDPGKSFRAWLGTVTRNKCVDFLRRQKSLVGLNDKSHAIQLQLPDNAEMIAEAEHRQYLIRRAIELMQSQLPPTMWQAIHRHIVLDQPAPEVAGELGITANAIYVAKSRVLRQIRQELAELLV